MKRVGETIINKNHILSAKVDVDEVGKPALTIKLTPEGAQRMAVATKKNIGKQLALMIDGEVKIAPVINSAAGYENLMVSGNFRAEELEEIASALRVKLDTAQLQPLERASPPQPTLGGFEVIEDQ